MATACGSSFIIHPVPEPSKPASSKRKLSTEKELKMIKKLFEKLTLKWVLFAINFANDLRGELEKVYQSDEDASPAIQELLQQGTVAGGHILDWNATTQLMGVLREVLQSWNEFETTPCEAFFKKFGESYKGHVSALQESMIEIMNLLDDVDGEEASEETRKVLARRVIWEDVHDVAIHWLDLATCMVPLEKRMDTKRARRREMC